MNAKDKDNLITSILIAFAPIGPLSFLLPIGALAVGFLVVAALIGLGYMEYRQAQYACLPKR